MGYIQNFHRVASRHVNVSSKICEIIIKRNFAYYASHRTLTLLEFFKELSLFVSTLLIVGLLIVMEILAEKVNTKIKTICFCCSFFLYYVEGMNHLFIILKNKARVDCNLSSYLNPIQN